MSPLITRPGRNAAREAKRIKEVRKVKHAIQWHEKQRKKRQEISRDRWEAKQASLERIKWEAKYVTAHRKRALANIKQDWRLGPLRPNRAIDMDADKYGALNGGILQKPEIPVRSIKTSNAFRERKGLAPHYPLIVDDNKYFPIVKGDRVAVLSGKDKGKIGVVREIVERTHEVYVEGLNMQYFDSDVYGASGSRLGPKQEAEVAIPMDDVRLVVPYEINQGGVRKYQDVVVEELHMELHTTGIDPFTGTDYGDAAIPENHRYDPKTGLPIFHRYIAGTRHRLEWPWERELETKQGKNSSSDIEPTKSLFQKALGTARHPITSLQSWRSKSAATSNRGSTHSDSSPVPWDLKREELARNEMAKQKSMPTSQKIDPKPPVDGIDSTRNIVEGAHSMSYTLVAPPFPPSLASELRTHIQAHNATAHSTPDGPSRIKIKQSEDAAGVAREVATARSRAARLMKTPMQVRWEMDQQRKAAQAKASPLVRTDVLLAALGEHMQKKGVRVPRKTGKNKKGTAEVE